MDVWYIDTIEDAIQVEELVEFWHDNELWDLIPTETKNAYLLVLREWGLL